MRILLIIFISGIIHGQNLVTNPSFESYLNCPTELGQISNCSNWSSPPNTFGTPDYFNFCSMSVLSVPENFNGYQDASDGGAYSGIMTYDAIWDDYREYIQTKLSSPLTAGETYLLTFDISRADDVKYASNNMGAVFTIQSQVGTDWSTLLNVDPDINNQEFVLNSSGWTTISAIYTANGDEEYLTLGNFFSDQETSAVLISNSGSSIAYYYIDNISLTPTSLGVQQFTAKEVSIYPNPTANLFYIATYHSDIVKVELYSPYRHVKSFNPQMQFFNIEEFQAGIYYVILTDRDGNTAIRKIIKQ